MSADHIAELRAREAVRPLLDGMRADLEVADQRITELEQQLAEAEADRVVKWRAVESLEQQLAEAERERDEWKAKGHDVFQTLIALAGKYNAALSSPAEPGSEEGTDHAAGAPTYGVPHDEPW